MAQQSQGGRGLPKNQGPAPQIAVRSGLGTRSAAARCDYTHLRNLVGRSGFVAAGVVDKIIDEVLPALGLAPPSPDRNLA